LQNLSHLYYNNILLSLASTLGLETVSNTHRHTHPFNGPFSGTTQVSRYQKGKTKLVLLKQETGSGSGTSWSIIALILEKDRSDRQTDRKWTGL